MPKTPAQKAADNALAQFRVRHKDDKPPTTQEEVAFREGVEHGFYLGATHVIEQTPAPKPQEAVNCNRCGNEVIHGEYDYAKGT